jgi:hypothetical protein
MRSLLHSICYISLSIVLTSCAGSSSTPSVSTNILPSAVASAIPQATTTPEVVANSPEVGIRPDATVALNKLLIIIKAQPSGGPVRIEGYTDSVGSDAYNQKLSEQRATSVKTWLMTQGISASRLQPRGFGETKPRAPNTKPNSSDNPEGRQQNRRVEVFVMKG